MKNVLKTTSAFVLGLMLLTAQVGVANDGSRTDKTIEKARTMVKEAAPDDWYMLAKAADLCIDRKINLAEAKGWFEKSLSIKESAIGHEVAGDYYVNSKLYTEAVNHYIKSMKMIKEKDNSANLTDLQAKVKETMILAKK